MNTTDGDVDVVAMVLLLVLLLVLVLVLVLVFTDIDDTLLPMDMCNILYIVNTFTL